MKCFEWWKKRVLARSVKFNWRGSIIRKLCTNCAYIAYFYQLCDYTRDNFLHTMMWQINSLDVHHCISKAQQSIMTDLKQQRSDSSKMLQAAELLSLISYGKTSYEDQESFTMHIFFYLYFRPWALAFHGTKLQRRGRKPFLFFFATSVLSQSFRYLQLRSLHVVQKQGRWTPLTTQFELHVGTLGH